MPALSIRDAFEMALAGQTSQVAGLEPPPLGLLLYSGHDEWQAHQLEVDALRDRFTGVKVQLLPSGPLSVLAPAAASGDAVNLLQGALAVASPLQANWKSWRVAAVLAASLLCLHLGARYFELTRLRKSEAALDASIQRRLPRRHARTAEHHECTPSRRSAPRGNSRRRRRRAAAGAVGTSPMRAARRRPPPSKASRSATAPSSCASPRPDAASLDAIGQQLRAAQLAGGHHGRQCQWR